MRGGVFLDRDGVVNSSMVRDGRPYPPGSIRDVEILPGVADAVRRFAEADLVTIVVTNQPDIGRGTTTDAAVGAINAYIAELTGIEHFVVCPHDDADQCVCRKPKPGMILDAAADLSVDLRRSVMVGDRWRDVEAGQAAGIRTVWIDRGYDERRPTGAMLTVSELVDAIDWILFETKGAVV